jgi:hypothetical protein
VRSRVGIRVCVLAVPGLLASFARAACFSAPLHDLNVLLCNVFGVEVYFKRSGFARQARHVSRAEPLRHSITSDHVRHIQPATDPGQSLHRCARSESLLLLLPLFLSNMASPARTVWLWKTALKQLEELPAATSTGPPQPQHAAGSCLPAAEEFSVLPTIHPSVWAQLVAPDLKVRRQELATSRAGCMHHYSLTSWLRPAPAGPVQVGPSSSCCVGWC